MVDENSPKKSVYSGDCDFTAFLRDKAAKRHNISKGDLRNTVLAKARAVKLLLLDVDGVLTDGSITYTDRGDEVKTFNAKDGFGLNILQKIGIEVGIITARKSLALERRLDDFSLTHVYQGVRHKVQAYDEILAKLQIQSVEVAYMGDDWLDLPLLSRVGFAATVADAVPEVKEIAHFVTENGGGRGAVREVCDLIIEAKGEHHNLLNHYLNRK